MQTPIISKLQPYITRNIVWIAYIVQQIIFIVSVVYIKKYEANLSTYFLAFFFTMLYLSILYGYVSFGKSLKMAFLFGLMEYLLVYPVYFTASEYSCMKCTEINITEVYTNLFYFYLFIYLVSLGYFKICGKLKICINHKNLSYALPAVLISLFIIFVKLLDDFILYP
jgi:hypothetical protein